MKVSLFLLLMLSSVLLLHTAFALVPMGNLVVIAKPEKSPIKSDEIPVLVGTVTDQASKPIASATVNINTSYGIFKTTTGNDGKFRYQYSNPLNPAQYQVNIKAQKDGYGVGLTSITFFVSGTPVPQLQKYELTNSSNNNINQDPVASKILKSVEVAKNHQVVQDAKIKQNEEEKRFVDGQRALADQQLQTDLQGWFAQLNPFTPRNVYASFILQVNENVAGIFWGQFNFTEKKTNDGLAAKNLVLQNGGSNDQARNAFVQNASSSRSEIILVNKDLNLKYGNASNDVQSKFDKYGNLR